MTKSIAKKEEDFEEEKDKKIRNLELEVFQTIFSKIRFHQLANEKIKVAEFQHINDELIFEIKVFFYYKIV